MENQNSQQTKKQQALTQKNKRVRELVAMGRAALIKANYELDFLQMKNIQFKKVFPDQPEKNIKRSTEGIAELIYFKELELKK